MYEGQGLLMRGTLVLGALWLSGSAVAAGDVAAYVPKTIEQACEEMNTSKVASCQYSFKGAEQPHTFRFSVVSFAEAAVYKFAAYRITEVSCAKQPTFTVFAVSVGRTMANFFSMGCSQPGPVKILADWKTAAITEIGE